MTAHALGGLIGLAIFVVIAVYVIKQIIRWVASVWAAEVDYQRHKADRGSDNDHDD